jgi:alpha-L-arabinofuranosidase
MVAKNGWNWILLLLCLPACGSLAAPEGERAQTSIVVDGSIRLNPISRNLFGKFTEHLGRNVYQGAWAQMVVNPEFAPAGLWPNGEGLQRRLQAASSEFSQESLVRDSRFGMAAFWSASEGVRARGIEDGERHIQELRTAEGGGSIETGVFAPLHRVLSFELQVEGRADRPNDVHARLMTAGGQVLGEVSFPLGPERSVVKRRLEASAEGHEKGDPYLFGLVFEGGVTAELERVLLFPSDHVEGWEPEVVEYMRKARLPMLRFPGGNFVSGYHWQDGVGGLNERPVRRNSAWRSIEWNHVGTDEWLRLCELVGAEPLICINGGNGTVEEARRWVEYCNGPVDSPMGELRAANGHAEPYGVRYWEIGNELYGAWQTGYTDGSGYAPRYGEFVEAMRRTDPDLLFIANGLGNLRRTEGGHEPPQWNHELVKRNGNLVRSISVHPLMASNAPEDADPEEVWRELVAFADGYVEYLDKLVGEPMRQGGLTPKVAITEMQIFTKYRRLPTNKSIAEALWLGSMIHSCARSGGLVEMLTHSALLNHGGGLGKNRGVVYADPVWWATHLYGSQPGTIPVSVKTESERFSVEGKYLEKREDVPYLDAAALVDSDGRTLTVFVINRHPEQAAAATLELKGFTAQPTVETSMVAGDSLTTRNTWEAPGRVALQESRTTLRDGRLDARLPALSLTRMTFSIAE